MPSSQPQRATRKFVVAVFDGERTTSVGSQPEASSLHVEFPYDGDANIEGAPSDDVVPERRRKVRRNTHFTRSPACVLLDRLASGLSLSASIAAARDLLRSESEAAQTRRQKQREKREKNRETTLSQQVAAMRVPHPPLSTASRSASLSHLAARSTTNGTGEQDATNGTGKPAHRDREGPSDFLKPTQEMRLLQPIRPYRGVARIIAARDRTSTFLRETFCHAFVRVGRPVRAVAAGGRPEETEEEGTGGEPVLVPRMLANTAACDAFAVRQFFYLTVHPLLEGLWDGEDGVLVLHGPAGADSVHALLAAVRGEGNAPALRVTPAPPPLPPLPKGEDHPAATAAPTKRTVAAGGGRRLGGARQSVDAGSAWWAPVSAATPAACEEAAAKPPSVLRLTLEQLLHEASHRASAPSYAVRLWVSCVRCVADDRDSPLIDAFAANTACPGPIGDSNATNMGPETLAQLAHGPASNPGGRASRHHHHYPTPTNQAQGGSGGVSASTTPRGTVTVAPNPSGAAAVVVSNCRLWPIRTMADIDACVAQVAALSRPGQHHCHLTVTVRQDCPAFAIPPRSGTLRIITLAPGGEEEATVAAAAASYNAKSAEGGYRRGRVPFTVPEALLAVANLVRHEPYPVGVAPPVAPHRLLGGTPSEDAETKKPSPGAGVSLSPSSGCKARPPQVVLQPATRYNRAGLSFLDLLTTAVNHAPVTHVACALCTPQDRLARLMPHVAKGAGFPLTTKISDVEVGIEDVLEELLADDLSLRTRIAELRVELAALESRSVRRQSTMQTVAEETDLVMQQSFVRWSMVAAQADRMMEHSYEGSGGAAGSMEAKANEAELGASASSSLEEGAVPMPMVEVTSQPPKSVRITDTADDASPPAIPSSQVSSSKPFHFPTSGVVSPVPVGLSAGPADPEPATLPPRSFVDHDAGAAASPSPETLLGSEDPSGSPSPTGGAITDSAGGYLLASTGHHSSGSIGGRSGRFVFQTPLEQANGRRGEARARVAAAREAVAKAKSDLVQRALSHRAATDADEARHAAELVRFQRPCVHDDPQDPASAPVPVTRMVAIPELDHLCSTASSTMALREGIDLLAHTKGRNAADVVRTTAQESRRRQVERQRAVLRGQLEAAENDAVALYAAVTAKRGKAPRIDESDPDLAARWRQRAVREEDVTPSSSAATRKKLHQRQRRQRLAALQADLGTLMHAVQEKYVERVQGRSGAALRDAVAKLRSVVPPAAIATRTSLTVSATLPAAAAQTAAAAPPAAQRSPPRGVMPAAARGRQLARKSSNSSWRTGGSVTTPRLVSRNVQR